MSKHYGVKCAKCKTPIIISNLYDFEINKLEFGVMPLTPITCAVPTCGHSVQYESRQGFEFEIGEVPNNAQGGYPKGVADVYVPSTDISALGGSLRSIGILKRA